MGRLLQDALLLVSALVPPLPHFLQHQQPDHAIHDGPLANGGRTWRHAFDRAEALVKEMTIEDKVNLTTAIPCQCPSCSGGVPRLGIPGFCLDDGPAGPRYTDLITQFPSAFTAAASFDRDLIYGRAERIGREFVGKGINVALAPVTGGPLGRSPYAGRNWEAFSPDPYLSSTLSFLTVKGMQSSGLITCAKHYVLYEQEPVCDGPVDSAGGRTGCTDVSSVVDEKTFKELYLPTFAETVRAGTGAVMCSYNRINGTFACENSHVLNRVLKEELNFQGFVLSDYGATHSTVPSALAGLDMELPSEVHYGKDLLHAVKKGKVPLTRLDDMAHRILTPFFATGQGHAYPKTNWQKFNLADETEVDGKTWRNEHVDVRGEDHAAFARKVAAESTVLLKNSGVLPISKARRIGIFGSDAAPPLTMTGCGPDLFCLDGGKRRHWNGTVTIGGGSGAAYASSMSSPVEAISARARSLGIPVDTVLSDSPDMYPTINTVASASYLCIAFVSLFLVEGWDREHLHLDNNGEQLIKEVEKGCGGEVVVVMHVGGQVITEDWIDLPKIGAVVFAGYPGQESGNALADILFGDVNPSGKLPFTMGKAASDWPTGNIIREKSKSGWLSAAAQDPLPRAVFSEGLAIDYKWFDRWRIEPRFEFGFGLSYTSFELADLRVVQRHEPARDTVQPTNEKYQGHAGLYDVLYTISVNVTNVGKVAGAEVHQLYLTFPPTEVEQPPKHLRGYDKVYLEPGQTKTASFPLRKKDLSVWDVGEQHWRVPRGTHLLRVGTSSRKLPLSVELHIKDIV